MNDAVNQLAVAALLLATTNEVLLEEDTCQSYDRSADSEPSRSIERWS